MGLAVLLLTAGPLLAISAAHFADAAGRAELRAGAALRQVPATLLENASGQLVPDGAATFALVSARWDSPSGSPRTGVIEVPAGMHASQRVTIWVTKTGRLAQPPLSRAGLTERVVLTVLGTVLVLVAALSAAAAGVRLVANRNRMAGWDRAWAATSPRWSQSW